MFTCIFCLVIAVSSKAYLEETERIRVEGKKDEFFHLANPPHETLLKSTVEGESLFHSENLWDHFSNMNTSSSTNRIRYFNIRGIGERSEYDSMPSNSVGFFYDHIDLGGLSGVVSLYDVSQVEVLKGPQTFLYGDSSLGGNVLVTSSKASMKNMSIWGGTGSQDQKVLGGQVNIPLSEVVSVKAGVQLSESNGFFYNLYLQEDTSKRFETFANLGWEIEIGSSFLRTSHILGENRNGNDFWNTDSSYIVLSDKKGKDDQLTHGHSIEWTTPLSESSFLLLIGSYSHSDQYVSYDEDWNNNAYWISVPGWNKNYDYFKEHNRRKTNFHMKSIIQNRWRSWDISYGIHYYRKTEDTDLNSFRNSILRDDLIAEYTSDKFALLFNTNYHWSKKSQLDLSGRIEEQKIDYQDTGGFHSQKSNYPVAFNIRYSYSSENHTIHAMVARGFKGAGFNPETNLTTEQQEYNPEYVMNYELSWVYQREQLRNKVGFFYLDRRHHQITTSSQDDISDPSRFTLYVDNAAQSHHYGLEWQGEWTPLSYFSLHGSVGLMRAEFVDYELRNQSYNGRELAHSPTYTFSLSVVINFSSKIKLNLNTTGRDQFYYSNSHEEQSQPYELFNASLLYELRKNLQVSVWGKNLFNKRYSQRGFFFGNEPPNFNARLYEQNATPLQWGARAQYSF